MRLVPCSPRYHGSSAYARDVERLASSRPRTNDAARTPCDGTAARRLEWPSAEGYGLTPRQPCSRINEFARAMRRCLQTDHLAAGIPPALCSDTMTIDPTAID